MTVMVSGMVAAWREVRTIVLALVGVTVIAWLARLRGVALLGAALLGWIFYFFRDPERWPVASAGDLILAPADGKVTDIEVVEEPLFFQGPAQRVSVFLSLFDVHVQRAPFAGQVEFLHYQPGDFAPAFLKDTHSNEFNLIGFSTRHGLVGVKQITGILARRIVCWAEIGDNLERGQRLGLIKFGSRVDLLLPLEVELLVQVGQKVYGGQTVMGRWRV